MLPQILPQTETLPCGVDGIDVGLAQAPVS
jgi:hypothetical protein